MKDFPVFINQFQLSSLKSLKKGLPPSVVPIKCSRKKKEKKRKTIYITKKAAGLGARRERRGRKEGKGACVMCIYEREKETYNSKPVFFFFFLRSI